jgi:hypothetical protein
MLREKTQRSSPGIRTFNWRGKGLSYTDTLVFKNNQQSLPCKKRKQYIVVVSYNLLYSQYVAQIQINFFFVVSSDTLKPVLRRV